MEMGARLQYEKPQLQYWTAGELDEIEATMSGGGGYYPSKYSVYILNNVDGIQKGDPLHKLGHAAIMLQTQVDRYALYNFGPKDNKSGFLDGSVGVFADGDMSFSSFTAYCRSGGVRVSNGYAPDWVEGFDRYIRIDVPRNVCNWMRYYANGKRRNPAKYNIALYNCLSFVLDVLSYGGITLFDSFGDSLAECRVPNAFFDEAVACSGGVIYGIQAI